jgi:sporulation protein YlmC with PRC-barrel domain
MRGLFKGNPVTIDGHEIGVVKNVKLNESQSKHSFLIIIETTQQLDYQHLVASLVTENFIIGTQSINLQQSANKNELPNINGIPQIATCKSKLSEVYESLLSIDMNELATGLAYFPKIIKNIDLFIANINDISNELKRSVFINPDFQEKILDTAEHIKQLSMQMRIMFNPQTSLAVHKSMQSMSDVMSKMNSIIRQNAPLIDHMINRMSQSVNAFSKAPMQFLRDGVE